MATIREQLIQRILQLSDLTLLSVEEYLDTLECGDRLPLLPFSKALPTDNGPTSSGLVIPKTQSGFAEIQSGEGSPHSRDWPHAPLHRLTTDGTYIVTGGSLYKQHFFGDARRLDYLQAKILTLAKQYGWRLEAWTVFSNHYHFVTHATNGCLGLDEMLTHLHRESAIEVNRWDSKPGRKVWFNFWDTKLTYEKSYLARLNYVHQNAVKHRLVAVANRYPWCSAAWFERTARPAQVRTIYSFRTDKVKIRDDYEPLVLNLQ